MRREPNGVLESRVREQISYWFTQQDGPGVARRITQDAVAAIRLPMAQRQGAFLRLGDDLDLPDGAEERLLRVKRYLTTHYLDVEHE